MRNIGVLLLVTAALLPRSVVADSLEVDPPEPGPQAAQRELADRDGDRLSDSLNLIVDGAGHGEQIDVVVTFSVPGSAVDRARQVAGPFRVDREFEIIRGFSAAMSASQIMALSRVAGLHRIEEDFPVSATLDGASADFGGDDAAFDFQVDGSGIAIGRPVGLCIIDSGIDVLHEQLDNGKVVGFFDAVNGLAGAYDDNGHGTHVASIAAGDGTGGSLAPMFRGLAPGSALFGAKVLDSTGFGTGSQIIAGIEWCAARPEVDILSISIGTAVGSDGQDAVSLAVNCAADPDFGPVCGTTTNAPKIVVVGAGNAGPAPATVGSPGAAEKAITVTAVANPSGDGRGIYLSAFSSRGPTLDGRLKPDISAPGVRIAAADFATPDGYTTKNGTSMAAAFVSGVVALMLDADPDLRLADPVTGRPPSDRIREILEATAQDRGPVGPTGEPKDYEYGAGLLDAYGAVAVADGLTAGQYQPTLYPGYLRIVASVADGGEWLSEPFEITGDGAAIAATITIEGTAICPLGDPLVCELFGLGLEWSPDLDMELVKASNGRPVRASGSDITRSECALAGEFCGVSRQETVYYLPRRPGSFRLRVYSFTGGGTFALDVSGINPGL